MTQEQLIEELAGTLRKHHHRSEVNNGWSDYARSILPIIARIEAAATERAARICDEVAGLHACYAAKRIRETLP